MKTQLLMVYDAWYPGLPMRLRRASRRIRKHIDSQAPGSPDGLDAWRHLCYNAAWQTVENHREPLGDVRRNNEISHQYMQRTTRRHPACRDSESRLLHKQSLGNAISDTARPRQGRLRGRVR